MKLKKIVKDGKEQYICQCCDKVYDQIPLCFGTDVPISYYSVPDEERDERIEMEQSLCVIDGKYFFHRGRLEIPIIDHKKKLMFDVWLSISEENFEIRMDDWDNPNRVKNEPYFGWLQTQIPTYKDSINIKGRAIEEGLGVIPRIEIRDENHQLAIDQKNGISFEKAIGIIDFILDKEHL